MRGPTYSGDGAAGSGASTCPGGGSGCADAVEALEEVLEPLLEFEPLDLLLLPSASLLSETCWNYPLHPAAHQAPHLLWAPQQQVRRFEGAPGEELEAVSWVDAPRWRQR